MGRARPSRREDFEVAIICALAIEADAVLALFDHHWDDSPGSPPYRKAPGDPLTYSTGCIGEHDVVLAHLPGMGKVEGGIAAAHCRTSFPNIKLGIVSGICGAVPFAPDNGREVILGDVVVSSGVVQYDFGRHLPRGFVRKNTLLDNLGRPNQELRGIFAKLGTNRARKEFEMNIERNLAELGKDASLKAEYPGTNNDRLFTSGFCHRSEHLSCDDGGCDGEIVTRQRLKEEAPHPAVHVGLFASGDKVMKSAVDRDLLAEDEGIVAFEMEGAGVWDSFPCVVIKGVCDYADSHKTKLWQRYAAATAAACVKAFLGHWAPRIESLPCMQPPHRSAAALELTLQAPDSREQGYYIIPYTRNRHFVGREGLMKRLPQQPFGSDFQVRTALYGLGGAGKTQIALEYALRMKKANPTVSIFWVHAASIERFRQAFSAIASQCQINEKDDTEADVLPRVKRWMESAKSGKWLMILDNADDLELFCGRPSSPALGSTKDIASRPLKHYLPTCTHGSILITTRNRQVGIRLCDDMPVEVTSMSEEEAQALLRTRLSHKDKASVELSTLARRLDHLPLALSQASAYIQETDITVGRYLELLGDEEELVKMLSRDFEATGRDPETYHAVAHTWFLSFQEIEEQCRLATQVLSLMSLLDRQDIPYTILSHYYFYVRPDDGDPTQSELEEALGILKSFSLVTGTDNGNFDIHRLVQLVTQQWIKGRETKAQFATAALYAMYHLIPKPSQSEILGRNEYVPFVSHAKELFGQVEFFYEDDSEVKADLQLLLGIHLWKDGQWSDAERLVSEVIRYSTSKYGELHITTLACRKLLGMIYHSQGRWNESERILKDVIGSADQTLGKQSYVAQTSSLGLAELYNSQDRFVEASRLLESLMAISISCGGNLPNDEKEVASGHVNRSKRARILRKFVKPLGVLRRSNRFADVVAQDTSRKSSSENKPGNAFVVAVMIDLSSAYLGCGRFLEARLLAAGAFKLFQAPRDIEAAMVLGLENCETTLAHDPKWPVLPEASPRTTALINLGSGDMHSTIAAVVPKVEAGGACIITPMVSQILSNDFDWCKRGAWEVAIASANVCEADGQYLEAYEVNARVLKSQMAMLGARHVSTLWAMQRASRYLRSLLRYAEAETCCKQGLDYVKGAPVSDPIVALRLSAELSFVYAGQNRHIEAFKLMSDLIPSFVEKLGPDHHATLELKGSFGYEHQFAHSVEAGETILLSVLQAFQRLHGADSRWALATSLKLAMLLASSKFSSDQSSEAYDSFVQLLPLYTAKYGETHPETVILTMLAAVAASLEDPSVAVDFATRALDLGITYLETVPELHAAVVFVLYISYTDLGEYEKAIGFGRRACELSTNGAATGRVLALSSLFAELGLWADAADLLEKHLTHLLTTSYKHHGKTWVTMQCLALAFQAVGRLEEAAKLQLDVTEQGQSQLQVDELDSIETSYASTLMLFHKGRPRPEAYSELLFKQAESWCRTVGPYGEETTTGILSLRSEVIDCQEAQHSEQAEGTLRKLVELHKNYFDEDHTSTYRGLLDLADFLADQYRLVEAAPFYEELLRILEKHRGAAASWTLMAIRDLGECRVREKRPREAAELFMEEAFRARAAYGAGHFRTLHALSLFAEQLLRLGCWYQLKQLQLRLRNCPDLAALADSRALKHSKANSDEKSGTDSDADSDTDIDVDVADQDKEVFEGIFLNLMKLEHSPELHEQILQKVEKASRSKACVVLATCNLAQVLIKRGALAESWRLLDPLLQRPGDSSLGSAHRIALTTANLARCNQQRGHWKEMGDQYVGITQLFDTHMSIEDIFQSVNHLFAGLSTSEHDYSLKPQSKASSVDTELPETGRAYTMAHRAREAAKLVFGADDEITLVIQVSIAHMLYDKAEQGRAIETLKDAAELQKLALGPDYRETQSSMQTLQQWENCAKVDSQSTTLREEFVA